ncbi:MAG: iron-containing alcohol dehydrogenase [Vicinamibacteria bacterium]|nr:iron-containing alcohol dehydrogenase [Vicinamibacteria bacterium]
MTRSRREGRRSAETAIGERFEFSTTGRILFGAGVVGEAPAIARAHGRRVLLVTGREAARSARLVEALRRAGLDVATRAAVSEPTIDDVRDHTRHARESSRDLVIAMGGGSAIDTGKSVAALLGNGGDPLDYIEIVGRGRPLERPSTPFIAIPTTAGTGTEVTRNAVLVSRAHGVKASLRGPFMLPAAALVDPDLLRDSPPSIIAASGLDALSQLIEPFVCKRANPATDALCRDGLARSARSLRRAHGCDLAAAVRADLALASLFGGLGLANAGLGAVHGFAAPIGGRFAAPHGLVCAALLPSVMEINIQALRTRASREGGVARYREIACILTGRSNAAPEDGVTWVRDLTRELGVPRLASFGVSSADIPALVERAKAASSMRANPVRLTDEELAEILEGSL